MGSLELGAVRTQNCKVPSNLPQISS